MPPGARRITRRFQFLVRALIVLFLVLAAILWCLCYPSYKVRWSVFTHSPPRVIIGYPTVQRDETHFMLGHGRLAILSHTCSTISFDGPDADIRSHDLAWLVVDGSFPTSQSVRCSWSAPGPLIGCPVWMAALAFTLFGGAGIFLWRRHAPPGHCPKCRYDLRPLIGRSDLPPICPECGAEHTLAPPDADDPAGTHVP
jgi:hypothetical protein